MTPSEAIDNLRAAVVVLSRAREHIPEHGPLDTEICRVRDALASWRMDMEKRGKKR
jgi:hypothetical protein